MKKLLFLIPILIFSCTQPEKREFVPENNWEVKSLNVFGIEGIHYLTETEKYYISYNVPSQEICNEYIEVDYENIEEIKKMLELAKKEELDSLIPIESNYYIVNGNTLKLIKQ